MLPEPRGSGRLRAVWVPLALLYSVASSACVTCEPLSVINVRADLSAAEQPLSAKRLALRSAIPKTPTDVPTAPAPGAFREPEISESGVFNEHDAHRREKWIVEGTIAKTALELSGHHTSAVITLWYDANGNGTVDGEDLIGDSGAFDPRRVKSATGLAVTMKRVQASDEVSAPAEVGADDE